MDLVKAPNAVVLGAEHRLPEAKLHSTGRQAHRDGWQLAANAAPHTDPGNPDNQRCHSAGTLIAAPVSLPLHMVAGADTWEASPSEQGGRLCHAWLGIMGGITLYSAYFWCSEGWTSRNMAIMEEVARRARTAGDLWILAADFNMEPDEFAAGYWVMASGGIIAAPSALLGTCRTSTPEGLVTKVYDYFLVDPGLKDYVQSIEVVEDFPSAPHTNRYA